MPKEWLRYPTRERKREAAAQIHRLLREDGSEISWSNLEERAASLNISTATLSSHLKRLCRQGLVRRRVDASVYPPRTYYSLVAQRSQPPLKSVPEFGLQAEQSWLKASVKARMVAEDFYMILKGHIFHIVQSGADVAFHAVGIKGQILDEIHESDIILGDERAHERADELIDAWIRPRIHHFIDLCYTCNPKTKEPLIKGIKEAWLLYPLIQWALTDSNIESLEKELAKKAIEIGLRIPGVEGFKSPAWQLLTMPLAQLGRMSNEEFQAEMAEIFKKYGLNRKLAERLERRRAGVQ